MGIKMANSITYKELIDVVKQHKLSNPKIKDIIFENILEKHDVSASSMDEKTSNEFQRQINDFLRRLKQYYKTYNNHYDSVIKYKSAWTSKTLDVNLAPPTKGPSRPVSPWNDISDRTKRRYAAGLASQECELIVLAASKSAKQENKRDFSFVMRQAIASPSRPSKIRRAIDYKSPIMYSKEEALALIMDCNLSYKTYHLLRMSSINQHADIYPTYNDIAIAKLNCYPNEEDIIITETTAECKLFSLLQHTASRLIQLSQNEIEKNMNPMKDAPGYMTGQINYKYGFDGASSQKVYKQKFENELDENIINEESLFSTCLVPLQMEINEQNMWVNNVPSSPRFCRPIRLQYKKETTDVIKGDISYITSQLEDISFTEHEIRVNGETVILKLKHNMALTMVDGKAVNALTDTKSTQSCNICGAKPSEMNDISKVSTKPTNEISLQFGLSILHCWIRFFEYVLHIGYKMNICKWQARTAEEKEDVANRKNQMKLQFRSQMALIVDQPRVGYGNTNDGNTARRAFHDEIKFAEITGVDINVIHRLYVILQVISSYKETDSHKFNDFCLSTANLIIQLYPWFKMPPSVHKVLIHGSIVIENLLCPIGCYSEEALEAQNKHIRNARLSHSRKTSRIATITDQLHYLLISSDPVISNIRSRKPNKKHELSDDVIRLLKNIHLDTDIED